ncbi:hypothetical protein KFE96_07465 [Kordiimonas sp. SCSIO 12603]|uniref:hypothetical protein n=1 Tax=Kordiimonas sp. SCSIO 12603 TaxID=2829596 RepID=UPI00210430E1|nr:hypothetical protein [Kordiimonas sp. SCSIO 12603]UTW60140.1 hypothetical protein KFE96_07465 [Kordiimonas sp. SCSIO 12603]
MWMTIYGSKTGTWNQTVAKLSMLTICAGLPILAVSFLIVSNDSLAKFSLFALMLPIMFLWLFFPQPLERILHASENRDEREIALSNKANAFAYKVFGYFMFIVTGYFMLANLPEVFDTQVYLPKNITETIGIGITVSYMHMGLPRLYLAFAVKPPSLDDED